MNPVHEAPDTTGAEQIESLVEADSLVEEISIDGMCGVY
jgi:mycofactocin precursor